MVEVVAVAQIDASQFKRLRGGEAGRNGALAALRLEAVPKGVLATIAIMAAVAVALCLVLYARTADSAQTLVTRRGDVDVAQGGGSVSSESAPAPQAQPQAPDTDAAAPAKEEAPGLVVHVAGAVALPGVYELPSGSRVVDAVEAAGGAVPGADVGQLNLAQPLSDGAKLTVPLAGEQLQSASLEAPGAGAARTGAAAQVNVNTASAEELQQLAGVGEVLAATIVRDREANGPFATPEDLMRVSGIGEKKFENMRPQVVV